MLAVFFTIVFVAELIVAGWIISAIKKLIVQVEQINLSVNQISPEIISTVTQVRAVAEMISSKLDATKNFIGDTKNDCICGIKKTLITSLLFKLMKLPGKRIMTVIDVVLTLRKLLKTLKK